MRLASLGLCHNRDQYEKACQSSQSQRKGGTSQLGDEVQHHQRWCYPEELPPVLHIDKATGPAFPEIDDKTRPSPLLGIWAGFSSVRQPLFVSYRSWRCGESNPGPLSRWRWHLRAQSSASFGHRNSDDEFPCAYPELIFATRSRNPG